MEVIIQLDLKVMLVIMFNSASSNVMFYEKTLVINLTDRASLYILYPVIIGDEGYSCMKQCWQFVLVR